MAESRRLIVARSKRLCNRVFIILHYVFLAFLTASNTHNPFVFLDSTQTYGFDGVTTFGGVDRKNYILETTGTGVSIFDLDNDGDEDVFIVNGARLEGIRTVGAQRHHLYRNDGRGKFTEIGAAAGLAATGWGQGVCAGDFDNDGFTDLLITHYGSNRLLRNTGASAFEDVTARVKLPTSGTRFGSGCAFVDYDRDGRLDVFIANYVDLDLAKTAPAGKDPTCVWKEIPVMCGPRGLPQARNVLYRQNSDGTFTDVSAAAGILKPGGRYALGVAVADFDNDGWPDIYVACDMTPSLLYQNRKNGTFEERGVEAGVAYNFDGRLQAGMGVAVADFDGDGRLDLAKTNFSGDLTSLFHNDDGRFFTDVSRQAGLGARQLLGWGIAFADFDDDGWPDLITANGHVYPEVDRAPIGERYRQDTLVYRNLGGGKFADVTRESGPALATPRPARGLATGDLDGDGRPEVVIVNMNEKPSALHNSGAGGNFINLRLSGTKSNRSAIGAQVIVTAGGRRAVQEVTSGGSFYSQNSFALHFGLGAPVKADLVGVRWPNGQRQQWKDLAAGKTHRLIEGLPQSSLPD